MPELGLELSKEVFVVNAADREGSRLIPESGSWYCCAWGDGLTLRCLISAGEAPDPCE